MRPADYERFPDFWDDPLLRKWNLWGYVDVRDVSQVIRRSLEAPIEGADVFIVAAADTVMRRDSADLLAEVYPDVPLNREVRGRETLLAIDHARDALGYEPEHTWEEQHS
jgi:nucleoside-diphosphate-sugar epimerase